MRWFRKRPAGAPLPRRTAARGGPTRVTPARARADWRSYDYDDVAPAYARVLANLTIEPAADLLSLLEPGPGSRILDVGTGTGSSLARAPEGTIGADASVRMLAEGRARDAGARLVAADVIDLPFRDATFSFVTANFLLPYVTKLDTALFDMLRVLEPGGRLGVTVWTEVLDDLTRTWRALAEEVLGRELMRDALKQGTPWAERTADAKHLEQVLRDAGLRPVTVHKRRYRNELPLEDYIVGREVEALGRYVRQMLGEERWAGFRARARERFGERFGERVLDFRDVLLAVATKPA